MRVKTFEPAPSPPVPGLCCEPIDQLVGHRGGSLPAPKLRYLWVGGAPVDLALKRERRPKPGVPGTLECNQSVSFDRCYREL